ncbi:transposase [Streptomyces sp. NPDC001279]|uniref:transposase n=1 Tax=Streptomyces sp. NPDC001279 TaxID=3364556 RepID=UPI0036B167DC
MDTKGLPLFVMVTPADMTDRDAAKEVLFRLRLMHPEITIVWADSAYAGQLVTWSKSRLGLTVKTVSRPKDASGFVVLPPSLGRRTLACLDHARSPARTRLRTPHPALGITDHLGGDHHHDQAPHPPKLPQERTAGTPRTGP